MNKKLLTAFGLGALALGAMFASAQSGRTKVTWFVGVGTGGQPEQIEAEKSAVARYNKAQDKIELILEVVEYNSARDNLSARIAAGNAPDIVGPVGTQGANWFKGQFIDMDPLVAKFKPDLKGIDDGLLKFYKESQGGEGLPYAVYPSFFFYNKALFKESKLPDLPTKVGEKYRGRTWDWNEVRRLGMELTFDNKGKNAASQGFDSKNIETYGFINQWNLGITSMGTTFKPANVFQNGKAVIDPEWVNAIRYYHNGIWKDKFMPSQAAMDTDLLGRGNAFNSGNVAMAWTHLWYTCCLDPAGTGKVKDWGVAVMPSYKGKTVAKLHADTFRIMKGSKVQEEAFQAMWWIMNQKDLLVTYGAFPADEDLQDDYIAAVNKKYAPVKINWSVVKEMLKYTDTPSHEQFYPNFTKVDDIFAKLATKVLTQPTLNISQEVSNTQKEIQRAFDEKK